jgi:hypothetical protein
VTLCQAHVAAPQSHSVISRVAFFPLFLARKKKKLSDQQQRGLRRQAHQTTMVVRTQTVVRRWTQCSLARGSQARALLSTTNTQATTTAFLAAQSAEITRREFRKETVQCHWYYPACSVVTAVLIWSMLVDWHSAWDSVDKCGTDCGAKVYDSCADFVLLCAAFSRANSCSSAVVA